jgi:hypothetical protein
VVWNDGFVFTVISEVDTQFDGRGHIGVEFEKSGYKKNRRWYNSRTAEEMNSTYRLQKTGIQKLYPIVAQEIQADTLASRGVETMQKGEVITMANIKTALKKQGMEVRSRRRDHLPQGLEKALRRSHDFQYRLPRYRQRGRPEDH